MVSVVIPTYNRCDDLRRAVISVQQQTFTDWEIVIVDNYSQDKTAAMISNLNDPRISFFQVHNEGIIARSRNLGISKSQGKYVAFLDSDDWWSGTKIEKSISALENGVDLIYHDLFAVRNKEQHCFWKTIQTKNIASPVFENLLKKGNYIINSSVIVRRSILNLAGQIDEQMDHVGWEDYDYWLKISRVTEKFHRLNETLGFYWLGGGNTSNPERSLQILSAIEKHYDAHLKRLNCKLPLTWMSYSRGRACQRLGKKSNALIEYCKISWSAENFLIKIKTLFFRMQLIMTR